MRKTREGITLTAVNETRCTHGAKIWFDKIIVAAHGTTCFCIAQTLPAPEEWADTEN